ncbi:MAG: hypothetical protein OXT67_06595 [Zetaproteobacteria bacterium]|nr:hypothetical protein [Zetaproteobacteria bacterium]
MGISLVLSGCITYRGQQKSDLMKSYYPQPSQKISISFTNAYVERQVGSKSEKRVPGEPIVRGHFLNKSKWFKTIQALQGKEDLQLRFKTVRLSSDRSFWKQTLGVSYFALSCLSLGLIPYFEDEPRRLELQVWAQGEKIRDYKAADRITKMMWLPAIFWWSPSSSASSMWSDYASVRRQVDENLLRHVMWDLYHDVMPKPDYPAKSPPGSNP